MNLLLEAVVPSSFVIKMMKVGSAMNYLRRLENNEIDHEDTVATKLATILG